MGTAGARTLRRFWASAAASAAHAFFARRSAWVVTATASRPTVCSITRPKRFSGLFNRISVRAASMAGSTGRPSLRSIGSSKHRAGGSRLDVAAIGMLMPNRAAADYVAHAVQGNSIILTTPTSRTERVQAPSSRDTPISRRRVLSAGAQLCILATVPCRGCAAQSGPMAVLCRGSRHDGSHYVPAAAGVFREARASDHRRHPASGVGGCQLFHERIRRRDRRQHGTQRSRDGHARGRRSHHDRDGRLYRLAWRAACCSLLPYPMDDENLRG